MAAAQDQKPTTKKFGKGERTVPHSSQKASKYYPAEDVSAPKKVCRLLRITLNTLEADAIIGRPCSSLCY